MQAAEDEDDPTSEEVILVGNDLKSSTQKLIRQFSIPQNREKLERFHKVGDGEF